MTWQDLRALSESDQRAIDRFVRSLGPPGAPAPVSLRPEVMPAGPFYDVIPQEGQPKP